MDYLSSALINHMVNQESITKQTARKLREALKAADRSVRRLSNQSGTPVCVQLVVAGLVTMIFRV